MSLKTCINGSHGAFCLARLGLLPSKFAEDTSDTLTHHGSATPKPRQLLCLCTGLWVPNNANCGETKRKNIMAERNKLWTIQKKIRTALFDWFSVAKSWLHWMTAPAKRFKLSSVEFRGCITLGLLTQVVFFSLLPLPMPLETFCKDFQSAVSAVFDGSDSVALAEHTMNHGFCRPGPTRQPWHLLGTIAMIARESVSSKQRLPVSSQILVELRLAMTRSYGNDSQCCKMGHGRRDILLLSYVWNEGLFLVFAQIWVWLVAVPFCEQCWRQWMNKPSKLLRLWRVESRDSTPQGTILHVVVFTPAGSILRLHSKRTVLCIQMSSVYCDTKKNLYELHWLTDFLSQNLGCIGWLHL